MEQTPNRNQTPVQPPPPSQGPGIISSAPAAKSKMTKKKKITIFSIGGVIVVLALVLGTLGYIQHQSQVAKEQAALAAKKKAEAAAAYQRQGTIQEIEESFQPEFKLSTDQDTRLIFSENDALQNEAKAAGFAGANNATNL